MQKINKIKNFLLSLFSVRTIYRFKYLSDFPNDPANNTVYLLGNIDKEWLAGFICPCGCGEFVELVLLKDHRPNWILTKSSKKKVTIRPSIHKKSGCKSHFFITKGEIEWCKY